MTIEILMPALSPTMEKGTLSKWLVAEGDEISSGDLIAEIETDKATMEVEAAEDGRVGRLVVAPGTEDVAVGTLIALLLEDDEDASSLKGATEDAKKSEKPKTSAIKPEVKEETSAASKPETAPAEKADQSKPAASNGSDHGARVVASPLAKRLARQAGINLDGVKGSGPGGRIVKKDLEGVEPGVIGPARTSAASAPAASVIMDPPADVPFEEVKLSAMRKIIAQRLTQSKQTVPHFYLTVDIEIDSLLAVRKELNAAQDEKLSVNDFMIRALGVALKHVPEGNVQYAGDKMYHFSRADVSVAVAIDGGLITPVIRGAETKGLATISAEMKELAEKAKSGKLQPSEYQGGTVSLSNLGMFGIKHFDAVINPPQAAILAVGAGEQRAVVKDGELTVATIMTATLSCDHRAIDGAVGARLISEFKKLVENPISMLI